MTVAENKIKFCDVYDISGMYKKSRINLKYLYMHQLFQILKIILLKFFN